MKLFTKIRPSVFSHLLSTFPPSFSFLLPSYRKVLEFGSGCESLVTKSRPVMRKLVPKVGEVRVVRGSNKESSKHKPYGSRTNKTMSHSVGEEVDKYIVQIGVGNND